MAAIAAASSSSSSSIVPNSCKYDVFISFRGQDTRNNFTSHLHRELLEAGILAYIDAENLEKGEEISTLLRTIEESRLSTVIFSKNYASSRWCLDELVCIMKCNKEKQHIVLPVFHGIDPSDVRHQKGSYSDAFVKHEERYKKDKTNKVQEWRNALTAAADLSGFDSQNGLVSESKLIEEIVKAIVEKLYSISKIRNDAFKNLVGMEKRFEQIESLLCVSYPDIRIIGIWGMGGIGKTTLAKTVYTQFYSKFEGCFFATFREELNEDELHHFEENLMSTLLKDKNLDHMPSYFANDRLRRKRVFIVLDNVNQLKQLETLLGAHVPSQQKKDRFGVGSRIILTSRDRKLLEARADVVYEVEALKFDEALKLFCWKAFGGDSPKTGYVELSKKIIYYAQGNPLALDVLGSYLHSRSVREWESALIKLEKAPDESIEKVLKTSYDALDEGTKAIFLDIACFFQSMDRDLVESILGVESHIGMNILIEKSLITISPNFKIEIHDLLKQMALEIVKQESKEVGRRSRLYNAQDVYYVLKNNKGTAEIEGIFLDLSKIHEDLSLSSKVFENMCNLRLLMVEVYYVCWNIKRICFPHGLDYLPHSLRYLIWYQYPLESLPSNFEPSNLIKLKLHGPKLKGLWNGVKHLGNLKDIDLSKSNNLIKLPDLSEAPKLENIMLNGCASLRGLPNISASLKYLDLSYSGIEALPSSFGSLENLVRLQLHSCDRLKNLPELPMNIEILDLGFCRSLKSLPSNIWKLKSLQKLNISDCPSLKILPEISEVPERLHDLSLSGTRIQELPTSIENIIELCSLDWSNYENLKFIPKCIFTLNNLSSSKHGCFPSMLHGLKLTRLELGYCNIQDIPDWFCSLSSLTFLDLGGNDFERIPSRIRQLDKLDCLYISHCKRLRHLPELPLSIIAVEASDCTSLQTVDCLKAFKELPSRLRSLQQCEFPCRFQFYNCWEMDQSSRHNILIYFIYRVYNHIISSQKFLAVATCYPGNEIPDWFSTKWEGSTATTKLPPYWLNNNVLGFAICVVLEFHDSYELRKGKQILFELHFKINDGEKDYGIGTAKDPMLHHRQDTIIGSDHMFMWYRYDPNMKIDLMNLDEVESSIRISCNHEEIVKVKRCGLRLIYDREALEECPNSQEDPTVAERLICQDLTLSTGSYSEERFTPVFHDCSNTELGRLGNSPNSDYSATVKGLCLSSSLSSNSNAYGGSNSCLISELLEEPKVVTNDPQPNGAETINSDAQELSMHRIKRLDICGCLPFLSIIIEWKERKEN